MVIGNPFQTLEQQLAPFHEFECTGINDQYVQDVDITDDVQAEVDRFLMKGSENPLQEALEWYGYEKRLLEEEDDVEIEGVHKYGYVIVEEGKLVQAVRRTNPNAKWDWWVLGGRWTGFLKLKDDGKSLALVGEPGLFTSRAERGFADASRKGEIDWEGMRDKGGSEAAQKWDGVRAIAPQVWESWESVLARYGSENIDQAREFYHNQEGRRAVQANNEYTFMGDEILVSREEYVNEARKKAVTPFAILHDGQWIERGKMGWFASVYDETPKDEWYEKAEDLLDNVSDDTMIYVVDCHI